MAKTCSGTCATTTMGARREEEREGDEGRACVGRGNEKRCVDEVLSALKRELCGSIKKGELN